jgi:hypothetical protein
MTSDEALMLEFQGGSRAAFEELFARYRFLIADYFAVLAWKAGMSMDARKCASTGRGSGR